MEPLPRLTAISRRTALAGGGFEAWVEGLCRGGIDAIQIRDKEASDRERFELARRAVETAAGRARVMVNGRADIAVAAGAGGVHLPAAGVPVAAVRRLLGPGGLVGRSTHSLDEIDRARDEGADYVYYGPIFDTPGKEPVGLARLARACRRGVPVIAIGGIRIDRLEAVAEAGAVGVAAIRTFADPTGLPALTAAAARCFPR